MTACAEDAGPTLMSCTSGGNRVGAICIDGYRSTSIGSGACSNHGGVDYWLCEVAERVTRGNITDGL